MLNAAYSAGFGLPGFSNIPPPPTPLLIPHQVKQARKNTQNFSSYSHSTSSQPAVVSAKPTLYATPVPPKPTPSTNSSQQQVDFMALQNEVERKLKKLKNEKVSAELAISQGKLYFF